jgi:DNA repair exonuclease SbcCD ATPase subunit
MIGKTTLLDSIAWTLYGYLPKWGSPKGGPADAVIKRGETKCSVTVTLQHNGDTYEITRQRPVKLQIKKNGEVQEGKVSDLDKRMHEMVGMTDSQFLLSVYMPQKRKIESFFSMSDSDRTQLLSEVAGLEELDKALDRARGEKSKVQAEIEFLKGKVSVLEELVSKVPEEKALYTKNVADSSKLLQDYIDEDNYIRGDAEAEIVRLKAAESKAVQDIVLITDQEVSEHEAKIRFLKKKADDLSLEIVSTAEIPQLLKDNLANAKANLSKAELGNAKRERDLQKNETIRQNILSELSRMEGALKGNCNHCNQELPEATREQAAQKHLLSAKRMESEILAENDIPPFIELAPLREAVESALIALSNESNKINERPNQLRVELNIIVKDMNTEKDLIDLKRSSSRKEMDGIRAKYAGEVSKIEQLLKDMDSKIRTARSNLELHSENLKKVELREKTEIENLSTHKLRIEAAQQDLDEILDLIDLFGPKGFRTICFEDLISRISDRAGQLLSIMTDGLYGTRIEQTGETGKGEHRVILKPVLTRGGLEVPLDDLSGGAEATVTLAYDVAISEAIAENSPLFLDEALDGLDSQGKAEAVRLIEEVARTRPVFLIDHTDSIKSSVNNVITITYKNDTSTLEGSCVQESEEIRSYR